MSDAKQLLWAIINAYNATPEPCHYKIRESINRAQRTLADADTDTEPVIPPDPLRPAAESVAAWLESRATHYRELGLAPVASELDRQAGVLRAALAEADAVTIIPPGVGGIEIDLSGVDDAE